jgi:hypothetical protein
MKSAVRLSGGRRHTTTLKFFFCFLMLPPRRGGLFDTLMSIFELYNTRNYTERTTTFHFLSTMGQFYCAKWLVCPESMALWVFYRVYVIPGKWPFHQRLLRHSFPLPGFPSKGTKHSKVVFSVILTVQLCFHCQVRQLIHQEMHSLYFEMSMVLILLLKK